MSVWSVILFKRAQNDLRDLDKIMRARVYDKLEWLASNFDLVPPTPLTGEFSGMCKLRVGDYRVLYHFIKKTRIIYVRGVEHRSKVYKK